MPLTIKLQDEYWDNNQQMFIYPEVGTLVLEHSLISISKWESKWHKPFLSGNTTDIKPEEMIDYIRCMSIKGEPTDSMLSSLTRENIEEIVRYIENPMTATTVKEDPSTILGRSRNYTSSELLYSYMVNYGIPIECEKWHLNRLLTLIKVLNEQNKQPKKKSESELIREYSRIREANRAKMHL